MKIIVTGSTGTVGSAVLQRCIDHPSITSIVSVTRRPLDITDPKLHNIVHKDFLKYERDVLDQLKGAEACIWALGSPTSGKEVHIDYTWAAVNAFLTSLVPALKEGQKFRFIYTSGGAVPYLEKLSFLGSWVKLRVLLPGNAELSKANGTVQAELDRDLLAVETENPSRWETFVVRPWHVVDKEPWISYVLSNSYIFRSELGAAMVDAALNSGDQRIIRNAELRQKGQAALSKH